MTRTGSVTRTLRDPKLYAAYTFMLPALAILVLGLVVPLWSAFDLSRYNWTMGTPWSARQFVGFESFQRMLADTSVRESMWVTLRFSFFVIVLEMFFGIVLALAAEKSIRGASVFRTLFILPLMVSPVVVGLIWRYLFDARTGYLNYYLEQVGRAVPALQYLGFVRQPWLADPRLALTSIIITDIWQWTPFIFIIILAGLQALPSEVMEAAYIDGANWAQMTVLVKLPMLRSILLVALLMRMIDVFRALEVIFIMTSGGPGLSTEVLSLHIYKTAFVSGQLGYASTVSLLLIGIILVLSMVVMIYANPLKERTDF